jgi:hypothetical protein
MTTTISVEGGRRRVDASVDLPNDWQSDVGPTRIVALPTGLERYLPGRFTPNINVGLTIGLLAEPLGVPDDDVLVAAAGGDDGSCSSTTMLATSTFDGVPVVQLTTRLVRRVGEDVAEAVAVCSASAEQFPSLADAFDEVAASLRFDEIVEDTDGDR